LQTVAQPINTRTSVKWTAIILSALLTIAFFLPWVSWDQKNISGADMPQQKFFSISETNFGLANPFPQFDIAVVALWLIPALAIMTLILALLDKKTSFTATVTAVLALCLVTFYILFTGVLRDLGAADSLKIGIYLTIFAAAGLILADSQSWLKKIVWLVAGPILTYIGFFAASKQLENEKFEDTANTKAVYTVNAIDLIKEFQANDSLANAKYQEKIITVNGNISEVEIPNDSTVNIKFVDTTNGSYAIFPFHDEHLAEIKKLKKGDMVSLKGSCSGGVYSEILGTHSITFKRSTLNK
jgi:hypothetical protein